MKNIILCTKNKNMYDEFLESLVSVDETIKVVHVNKPSKILNVSRSFSPTMIIIDGNSFLNFESIPSEIAPSLPDKIFVVVHSTFNKKTSKKETVKGYQLVLGGLSGYRSVLAIKNNLEKYIEKNMVEVNKEKIDLDTKEKENANNEEKETIKPNNVPKAHETKINNDQAKPLPDLEKEKLMLKEDIVKTKPKEVVSEKIKETIEIPKKQTQSIEHFEIKETLDIAMDNKDKDLSNKQLKNTDLKIEEEILAPNESLKQENAVKSEEVHTISLDELKDIGSTLMDLEALISPVMKIKPETKSDTPIEELKNDKSIDEMKKEALLDVEKNISEIFSSMKGIGLPIKNDLSEIIDIEKEDTLKSIINRRNKREDRGKSYESILEDLNVKKEGAIPPKVFFQPEVKRYIPKWRKDAILTLFRIGKLKTKGFTQENIPNALRKIHDEEKRRFEKLKSINEAAVKSFDLSVSRVMIEPKSVKTDQVKLFEKNNLNNEAVETIKKDNITMQPKSINGQGIDFSDSLLEETIFEKGTISKIESSVNAYAKLDQSIKSKEKVNIEETKHSNDKYDKDDTFDSEDLLEVFEENTINKIQESISSYSILSDSVKNKEKVESFDEEETTFNEMEDSEESGPVFDIDDVEKAESSYKKLSEEWAKREKKVTFEETVKEDDLDEEDYLSDRPVFEEEVVNNITQSSSKFDEMNQSIREKDIVRFDEREVYSEKTEEEDKKPLSINFEKELDESSRRSMLITRANEKDKFSKESAKNEPLKDLFSDEDGIKPEQSKNEELYFIYANDETKNKDTNDENNIDENLKDKHDEPLEKEFETFPDILDDDDDEVISRVAEKEKVYLYNDFKDPRFIKKENNEDKKNDEIPDDSEGGFSFRRFQDDNKTSKSNETDLYSYNGTIEDIFGTKNSELTPNQVSLMAKFNEKAKQKKREEVFAPKDFSNLRDEIVVEPPRHLLRVEEETEPDKSKTKKRKGLFGFKK